MPNKSIIIQPGVNSTMTPTANTTNNVASNLIRFFQGFVQRIGGWLRLFDGPCANFVRAMHPWTDLSLNKNLLLGTDGGPQIFVNDTLYNFSLLRKSSSLTPPWYATTAASSVVTVTDVAHGAVPGDTINLPMRVGGSVAGYIPGVFGSASGARGLATNGTTIVAVQSSGGIRTSTDGGFTWTARTSGVATDLYGVVWTGTQYVVCGDGGVILTSPTGTTWTTQTSGTISVLTDIAWSGTFLCAVGQAGAVYTSPTGVTWTSRTSGVAVFLRAIVYAGTQFVVAGDTGTIITASATGVTWTTQTTGVTADIRDIAWSGSLLCAVGLGGMIITSPTAATWTARTSGTTVLLVAAASDGSGFVVAGASGNPPPLASSAIVLSSPTGTAWSFERSNITGVSAALWTGSTYLLASDNVVISPTGTVGQALGLAVGMYTVVTVPTADTYTIASPTPAVTSSASGGWAPYFVANYPGLSASTVRVYLQNHGLNVADPFDVTLSTPLPVNGMTLTGTYPVTNVVNSYSFDIDTGQTPTTGTIERVYENSNVEVVQYFFVSPTIPQNWFLDNLGENGLICATNGPIYVYIPPVPVSGLASASVIANSPLINAGMFVAMPQAQIVALGSEAVIGGGEQDPLLVRWSDAGSYTVWVATPTNLAGSYRLSRGSRIVGGLQGPQTTLLWTDVDCWAMSYVGAPLVYSFNTIAAGFGLLSPKARISQGSTVYWASPKGFCSIGSNGFREIDCPLWDTFFGDLDPDQTNKVWAWSNSVYHEIWFFYPSLSGGTGEIDAYIKLNTQMGVWDYGSLCRTSGNDQSVFGTPLAADENFRVQQHEMGYDADGVAMTGAFILSGYASLEDGTYSIFMDEFRPDVKWLGDPGALSVTLYGTQSPQQEATQYGPFTFTPSNRLISVRVRAKELAIRYDWLPRLGSNARPGTPRVRMAPDGRAP